MYRLTLAASWTRRGGELAADKCVEDIFDGGDGWGNKAPPKLQNPSLNHEPQTDSEAEGDETVTPSNSTRHYNRRDTTPRSSHSANRNKQRLRADKETPRSNPTTEGKGYGRGEVRIDELEEDRRENPSRSSSGSDKGREQRGNKYAREVSEWAARDDLRAWKSLGVNEVGT